MRPPRHGTDAVRDPPWDPTVHVLAGDRPATAATVCPAPSPPPASLPEPVAGLLFGMGDVLYDATLWQRWLLQLLARIGLHTHYRAFCRVWRREYLDDVYRGRVDFWEALRAMLLSVGLARGQIDEVVAAGHARHREFAEGIRPFPGVPATLRRLAEFGVSLGVLSNSPCSAKLLQRKLTRLGLQGAFRAVVSSADIGSVKPEPACYRAALSALGLPASRVAMVGHDADELAGAAAVGMRTIAFNYDEETQADVYLERFDQLLQVVPRRPARLLAG